MDPTQQDSSTDESEYGDEARDEVTSPNNHVSQHSADDIDENDQTHGNWSRTAGDTNSPSKFRGMDSMTKLKKALSTRDKIPMEVIDLTV